MTGIRLFAGAAPYYARFRPGYPPELLADIADRARLDGKGRLLDLGCGTGNVAIPLAAHVEEVVAVDVEPEMLAELQKAAPPNIRTVEGAAEDVDETWGTFRLATIGAALHWFESAAVLGRLSRVTPVVALLGEPMAQSEAMRTLLAVSEELLGKRPGMKSSTIRYDEALANSPFSDVEKLSVQTVRTWTPDEVIGLAYSTSFASLERVGEQREEFERLLRARLKPRYRERISVDAFLGRRV